jgi:hypothetical protein
MTITTTAPLTLTLDDLRTAKGNLKARKAIAAGTPLVIRVTGLEGFLAGTAIARTTSADAGAAVAVVDGGATVVVTLAAIAAIVAIAGLGVVATVCIVGINAGYRVTATHVAHSEGTIFDDELKIVLVPPGATS